ncbi:hypothetical protein ADK41_34435 [Streptomyces caelestis]|uniref:ABC transporter domain-containing protein n=1 Tax=Streptomyces caelestis TaxID=36816 RepID=A0A0M8QDK3_9ACTN|nr:hypothetical protein ADK41_34435 [Streptomyces caelestis]
MDGPLGLAVMARDFGLKGPRGWAFRGISADAEPGSLIAVEGPSGSGRTRLLLASMSRRALAAGASARRIALAGWLPVVAIGVPQTLALMSVLHWALGLQMARAAGTVGFLCLVTACFAAIVQWLNARFGAAGRILVLALLMLQLTSAGGTYPVQTGPGFLNALRRLITGGGLGPVWQACAVLAAFTAGALALTALSARRRQVWTVDRLHPELSP